MRLNLTLHWGLGCLIGLFAFGWMPTAVHAQKNQVKGNPQTQKSDSLNKGKGNLKAAVPKDTLKGGDGFIPRTVVDSFPRMPEDSATKNPKTSVTQKSLDDARKRMEILRKQIIVGDSMVAMRRMDPQPEWPPARVEALADAIAKAKLQLADAEKRHASLQKRYDLAMAEPPPAVPKADTVKAVNPPATPPKAPANAPSGGKSDLKGGTPK